MLRSSRFVLVAGLIAATSVQAAPWGPAPGPGGMPPGPVAPFWGPPGRGGMPPGSHVPRLFGPMETAVIAGVTYFVLDGVFYRREPQGYVVVDAPTGAAIKVLPSRRHRVLIPPYTYYVVDGTYYRWDNALGAYIVVAEPLTKAEQKADAATTSSKIFVYPAKGQGEQQTKKDREACHAWAVDQSGDDPSGSEQVATDPNSDYRRALGACLEARGYTVR